MKKSYIVLALAFSMTALLSSARADDFGIPIVYGATVDANANTLTLTGAHFGQSPTITLGGVLPLTVQSSSPTQIVANVPAALAPGSYLIVAKFSNFTVAVFEATVGTVGPRGPQGTAGPAGPAGPTGAQGAVGPAGMNGVGVTVTAVPTGDANCPTGGVLVSSASGNAYVCNGVQGAPGTQATTKIIAGRVCHLPIDGPLKVCAGSGFTVDASGNINFPAGTWSTEGNDFGGGPECLATVTSGSTNGIPPAITGCFVNPDGSGTLQVSFVGPSGPTFPDFYFVATK